MTRPAHHIQQQPLADLPNNLSTSLMLTLAHVGRSIPPPGFVQFWTKWRRHHLATTPALIPIEQTDQHHLADSLNATHLLRTADDTRIPARLSLPPDNQTPTGFVITTHGYHVQPDQTLPNQPKWTQRQLGVLALRVRGFPGATIDNDDWASTKQGWIARGITDIHRWSLPAAVADLISAVNAIRNHSQHRIPIALHGESFGAALAILAASQLSGKATINRLALALPTMGDWPYRLQHQLGTGLETHVRNAIKANPHHANEIRANLRLFDTVVHARRIVSPVLMKLAANDPVVPPQTVGAIYNALGSAPATKWRFLVNQGHQPNTPDDDLRRHAQFQQLAAQFLDPTWNLDNMPAANPIST